MAASRALIFAAGRGERMRPLSDAVPKPLLCAGGRRLIEWQIAALAAAGIREIVVNVAHLAAQFAPALGDGARYGVRLRWSVEGGRAEDALETLGGIVHALPLLGEAPFVAVSGDVVCDYDYARLLAQAPALAAGERDAHFVLVDNPPFHPQGDLGLTPGAGVARVTTAPPLLTYANIALLAPRLFSAEAAGRRKLFPWMLRAVEAGRVGGEHHRGRWYNVGTPDELRRLDAELRLHPLPTP